VNIRRTTLRVVRTFTANPPRIKGFGIALAWIANIFRGWNEEIEVRVFGKYMRLNSSDYLSNIVLFTPNYFDYQERKFIRRIIKKGDYVVDVGANIGIYTLILADRVTASGKVIAIEAERGNAARLRYNIALNDMSWVIVHEVGVSNKVEVLTLLLDGRGNSGAHSFRTQGSESVESHRIACKPLSGLLDPDRTPKFMKIDIEGFEYRVLKQYLADVSNSQWPHYLMLEDAPTLREGDAVALAIDAGYRLLDRINSNVILEKAC
jgi:FkbM family methyltransferase